MKHHLHDSHDHPDHAPGAGSDKQHPETPSDANERFKKQQEEHKPADKDREK